MASAKLVALICETKSAETSTKTTSKDVPVTDLMPFSTITPGTTALVEAPTGPAS